MPENVTITIDLLRHGEPIGGSKYRGQTDDPLSEKGWAQMRAAVGEHRPWDVILSSPLSRCRAFAEELATRHGLPLEFDERLMEIGFGAWEGRTAEELMRDDPGILVRFWNDPLNNTPPGAEPLARFRDRVDAAWQDLLARHRGRHVLVVCHAGVIRMCVARALDMPLDRLFRIQVPNAGLTRMRVDINGAGMFPRLVFHAGTL
ncbi:MAG: alpha-ribazole phosphatase [Gammaproteobacteria bacterium]|nr:MAG: alpha-ribazole phosphatase [Gammaproteobacteria bacterium]